MANQNPIHPVIIVANKTAFMSHDPAKYHPESPLRVEAIEKRLRESNAMTDNNTIHPRKATLDEIALCHDLRYIDELQKQINELEKLNIPHALFDASHCRMDNVASDFQISPLSWNAALYAAGAPLTAIEYILDGKHQTTRAFCIVRPPGHHAHQTTGSGFCIFNNVAIAAKYLTRNLGFKRVLIVDWDAHDGDGTQDLTEADPTIFYFSTHRDTVAGNGFYPGPCWGKADQQGKGKGKGTIINCPVYGNDKECREAIFRAFNDQLIPAMEKFRPQFVLISCGFDAHEDDPLVGLGLKDEDFRELSKICINIADKYAEGRLVSVLEGGYDLDAISRSALAHVETLQEVFDK